MHMLASPNTRRLSLIVLITAILSFHLADRLLPAFDALGRSKLVTANEEYLETASDEALTLFTLLSALKAGVAVMESSSTGVSFIVDVQVQVGRFLASMQEVLNYGWHGSLMSLTAIECMRLLLYWNDLLLPLVIHLLLGLLLMHYLLSLCRLRSPRVLHEGIRLATFFTVATLLLLPLSLLCAQVTSQAITSPLKKEITGNVQEHHQSLALAHEEGNMRDLAKKGVHSYEDVSKSMAGKEKHLSHQMVKHLTVVLFDALLFPLSFLFVTHRLLLRLLGDRSFGGGPKVSLAVKTT